MEPAPASTEPAVVLSDRVQVFLAKPLYAALATIDPDGAPRQAVIWYRLEDDGRILINSLTGRSWPANLRRDGRVALAITDPDAGESWVGISGRVDDVDDSLDQPREDIVGLAYRYRIDPTDASLAMFRRQHRISFRIAIEGVHVHLED